MIWEREAQVRAVALGKPGKPWDSWADIIFPVAGNWSKIGVDHMFDHNWKISYPGVAQLVARLLWEQDAGSSSLPTRTKTRPNLVIWAGFCCYCFVILIIEGCFKESRSIIFYIILRANLL